MGPTYAITWREASGLQYSGRLELRAEYLRLEGGTPDSGGARHVPYSDIGRFGMARRGPERLDGRQTLVVERLAGESLLISAIGEPGALAEIAERLAQLTQHPATNGAA